jgi:hypothetical protein
VAVLLGEGQAIWELVWEPDGGIGRLCVSAFENDGRLVADPVLIVLITGVPKLGARCFLKSLSRPPRPPVRRGAKCQGAFPVDVARVVARLVFTILVELERTATSS